MPRSPSVLANLALALALALACAPPAALARAPPPDELVGDWVGSFAVAFALADATNPYSWSCLTGGATVTEAHSISFGADGTVSDGPFPNNTVTDTLKGKSRSLAFPGTSAFQQYDFLRFNATSGILALAYPNSTEPACHWAVLRGGVLTLITVGGGGFGAAAQCAAKTYTSNVTSAPFCTSSVAGGIALGTNVVGTYTQALEPSATPSASASASATADAPQDEEQPQPTLAGHSGSYASPAPPAAARATGGAGAAQDQPMAAAALTLLAGVVLGALAERRAGGA